MQASNSLIGTGRTRSVPSKAIISAPSVANASASLNQGVILTGLSGKSRLTIPIIGTSIRGRVAFKLSIPSIRTATAPAFTAAGPLLPQFLAYP